MEELHQLITLQTVHMTQHTVDGHKRTPWSIEENITNKKLTEFPASLNEEQVFKIVICSF